MQTKGRGTDEPIGGAEHGGAGGPAVPGLPEGYEPPTITALGSLHELLASGGFTIPDAHGHAPQGGGEGFGEGM